MIDNNKPQSTIASLIWKFLEQGSVQFIQFAVGIVIARLLEPSAYGSVALLTIFIVIATVFVQSGLGRAIIQKKEIDSVDLSSVFWYSIAVAFIVYFLLFFSSRWIAQFYNIPELELYMKILALTLFPGAFNSIQIAYLSKLMQFRKQFVSSLWAAVVSGIIGIYMAYVGFGAWALIAQQLSYQVVVCFVLLFLVNWIPSFSFSFTRTKSLLNYGLKLLASGLIDKLYHNLESLIIGKFYSAATLAFCNKGKTFPLTVVSNIDGSLQSVMLPVFSKSQDNIVQLKSSLRKTISLSTYLVFPSMMLLAAVSKPMIGLLLGEKWLECVPYVILFSIFTMMFPLQTTVIQAINAIGKSAVTLKVITIKRIVGVLLLILSVVVFDTPYAIVTSCIITEIFGIVILLPYNKKLLDYSRKELRKDVGLSFIISVVIFMVTFPISFLEMNYFLQLIFQSVVGIVIFLLLSKLDSDNKLGSIKSIFVHTK